MCWKSVVLFQFRVGDWSIKISSHPHFQRIKSSWKNQHLGWEIIWTVLNEKMQNLPV